MPYPKSCEDVVSIVTGLNGIFGDTRRKKGHVADRGHTVGIEGTRSLRS